jgi:hypothetical protein
MTRSDIFFDEPGVRPATLAAGALFALLAALVYVALPPVQEAEPHSPSAVAAVVADPIAAASAEVKAAPPTVEAPNGATGAGTLPQVRARPQHGEMPYRFMGKSTTGAETSIVLFGRGRVVNLRGPGPLDDEYVVDAVFDEYLVVRHVPTSVAKFLAFARPLQGADLHRDPEESPRD